MPPASTNAFQRLHTLVARSRSDAAGHQLLMDRVRALRANFTAYDAINVALAERLDARLLTGDRALARAEEELVGVRVVTVWAGR